MHLPSLLGRELHCKLQLQRVSPIPRAAAAAARSEAARHYSPLEQEQRPPGLGPGPASALSYRQSDIGPRPAPVHHWSCPSHHSRPRRSPVAQLLEATANKTMKNRKIKPQKDTKI